MNVYLANSTNIPKYRLLFESIYQLISQDNCFEIIEVCSSANCIVCIGDLTQEIKNYRIKDYIPVIRFLFRSDVSTYFYTDVSMVDFTFWVNDLDINILFPFLQTSTKISVPFCFNATYVDKRSFKTEYDIYVNTGEHMYPDSALYKILRTLNRLTQLTIDVCSKNNSLKNSVNQNVVISDSTNDIERHVIRSRMVIGSGYAIFFAIKHHKPFIVLGERGYGGVPTLRNFQQYYMEFFQGTIGGRFDGALPENLVYEDIQEIIKRNYNVSIDLAEALLEVSNSLDFQISNTIRHIIGYQHETDLSNVMFNTDYTIIQSNDNYWLLHRYTRFLVKKLEKTEVEIIKHVLNENYSSLRLSSDNEIINSLLKSKILMRNFKNHFIV